MLPNVTEQQLRLSQAAPEAAEPPADRPAAARLGKSWQLDSGLRGLPQAQAHCALRRHAAVQVGKEHACEARLAVAV